MLQKPLVFVDIETTGSTLGRDRIIELALIRVENQVVVEEFQSFVDPEISIDRFISNLTGITNADVKSAPLFPLVFKQCAHLFKDAIFVAHNASFDYNFIKSELAQIGYEFALPRLCTVRLSRKLYPQYKSHSLDSIIKRHSIQVVNRHRAMDDVLATWAWWQIAHQEHNHSTIFSHVNLQLKHQISLSQIDESTLATLPQTHGVYIFYDQHQIPLFVGRSPNIQDGVRLHLADQKKNKTDYKLATQSTHVKGIPTSGELSSLLLESKLIQELRPLHNKKTLLKKRFYLAYEDLEAGYKIASLQPVKKLDFSQGKILGIFTSRRAFTDHLYNLTTKYKLDKKTENPTIYNLRFDMAFASTSLKPWTFVGTRTIMEYNPEYDLQDSLVVNNWTIEGEEPSLEIYQILKDYFQKNS